MCIHCSAVWAVLIINIFIQKKCILLFSCKWKLFLCRCGSLVSFIEGNLVKNLAVPLVVFYLQSSYCFLRLNSGCSGNSLRHATALVALITEDFVHYCSSISLIRCHDDCSWYIICCRRWFTVLLFYWHIGCSFINLPSNVIIILII